MLMKFYASGPSNLHALTNKNVISNSVIDTISIIYNHLINYFIG